MKAFKIILAIIGVVVIIASAVVITIGVERSIHRRAFEKKMPHLAGILGKERPRELLETIKIVRAIEVLDLNEEQIGKVISRWRKLDKLREGHNKTRKEKLGELEELLKTGAGTEEVKAVITNLKELDEKFKTDAQAIRDEINSILTPEQQAKLILFERDFHRQMQKFLERQPLRGKRQKICKPIGQPQSQEGKMEGV